MGFLKALLNANNAEGIREAMRIAYRGHRKKPGLPNELPAHQRGLVGAMGTRMQVNGLPITPTSIWLEIAPFAMIADEEVAAEALAEYAVYVERTVDAKIEGLKAAINEAFRRGEGSLEIRRLMASPLAQERRWYALLDPDVRSALQSLQR